MSPRVSLLVLMIALFAWTSVQAGQNDDERRRREEAERRQLENLRREVRELERTVKQVENDIESRKKQLEDAPKTINPAEKALAQAEKRHEKASAGIAELKKRVDEAEAKHVNALRSLKSQFDGASKLDEAEAKHEEARASLEKAKAAGVEKLNKDAAYAAAKERVATAKIRLEVLVEQREDGRATSADLADAGQLLFQFQNQLEAIEAKVLANDERYKQALKDVEETKNTIDYLRGQLVEKVKTHPDYVKAEGDLKAAREAYGAATRELAEASKEKAETAGTLSRLKAQVKEFERDTERLKSRKEALQSQLKAKERRAEDYARSIRR